MKILVIDSPFLPVHIGGTNYGGIEAYEDAMIRCAADHGDSITLIATNDSTVSEEYESSVTLVKTQSDSKIELDKFKKNPKDSVRFPYNQINGLVNTFNFNDFDLVINNSDKAVVNRYISQKQDRDNIKNVVSYIHNPPIFRCSIETAQKFNSLAINNQFVFNSDYNYNAWRNLSEHLDSLRSRMHLNYLKNADRNLQPVDEFNPKVLICIGRIVPHKGFLHLKELAKTYPDLDCHIIGSIGDNEEYNKLIKDQPSNLTIHLGINNEEKIKLIKELKGWTCSFSCNETYGITAAESFELGLPLLVIDNNDTNIPYFIKNHPDVVDNLYHYSAPIGFCMKKGHFKPQDIYSVLKAYDNGVDHVGIRKYYDDYCKMTYDHILNFYNLVKND